MKLDIATTQAIEKMDRAQTRKGDFLEEREGEGGGSSSVVVGIGV